MDAKLKGKIIAAIRKLTYTYEPRNNAKKAAKVAPATFKCSNCEAVVYTGQAKEVPQKVLDQFPEAYKGKVDMDHIDPVIPIEGFPETSWDWNVYIDRTFCPENTWQCICRQCHKEKTYLETQLRKEYRKNKEK